NQLAFRLRPEGVDDEHRGGLRHRLDDQHARHHRTAREMALEIIFVDRDVLDAGCLLVRHHVDDPVDHQKGVAMRDHFHDPLKVDLRRLLVGAGRIDHPPSFFLARRCRIANCRMNCVKGTAGLPPTVAPASMSRITPDLAEMRAPSPTLRWPARPTCPPAMTKSPSLVLPEIPT